MNLSFRHLFSVTVLLLNLISCSSSVKTKTTLADDTVHVVLLAGQSNMEGVGNFDQLSADDLSKLSKLNNQVQYVYRNKAAQNLTFNQSKYHQEKYGVLNVFGPEMFLAIGLNQRYPNQKYLFIKTAQGGTSLYGAWNPDWTEKKAIRAEKGHKQNLPLYKMLKENVYNQLIQLEKQGQKFKVIGMVWMQGENDAARDFSAAQYQENLTNLISTARKDFDFNNFVIGQINSTYGRFKAGPEIVRTAMQTISDEDKYVEIVNTSTDPSWSDFPKHDNVHYNTQGQINLGKAFASRLISLIEQN